MNWTTQKIRALKGQQRFATLTACDYVTGRLADEAGFPLILVGDSLAMTVLGYETTLPVTVEQMLHHTTAVSKGVREALVVADMPFMSYQVSHELAHMNAGRFLKEAGAGAVKIEGGAFRAPLVRSLVENGIPVLAHIGLTPQSVKAMGGFKVQGRGEEAAERLLMDAQALQEAGAFALVLEAMPASVAARITETVDIPTIGIGAGPLCDAQILVVHDLLGLTVGRSPKFVKRYAELGQAAATAFSAYKADVESGVFPAEEHCYSE